MREWLGEWGVPGTSAGGERHEYEQVGGGKGERSYLHAGWRRRRERGEHFPTQGEGSLQAECLAAQTNLTLVCHIMINDDISAITWQRVLLSFF